MLSPVLVKPLLLGAAGLLFCALMARGSRWAWYLANVLFAASFVIAAHTAFLLCGRSLEASGFAMGQGLVAACLLGYLHTDAVKAFLGLGH